MDDERIPGVTFFDGRKRHVGDVGLTDRGIYLISFTTKGLMGDVVASQFGLIGALVKGALDSRAAKQASAQSSTQTGASLDQQLKLNPGSVFVPLEELSSVKWSVWWGSKIVAGKKKYAFYQPPKTLKLALQRYCQERNIKFG